MTNQDFFEQCNQMGEARKGTSSRYDELAKRCGFVAGFTKEGLSFLASLLSDQYTAAGQRNEKGDLPDKSKVWAMPFLAVFNPEGVTCLDNPILLRSFARQVAEGNEQFEPDLGPTPVDTSKARLPSRELIAELIAARRANGDEVSGSLILEDIEEYYEENDMILPEGWEKMTVPKVKELV